LELDLYLANRSGKPNNALVYSLIGNVIPRPKLPGILSKAQTGLFQVNCMEKSTGSGMLFSFKVRVSIFSFSTFLIPLN
jgi:hypothetical protein